MGPLSFNKVIVHHFFYFLRMVFCCFLVVPFLYNWWQTVSITYLWPLKKSCDYSNRLRPKKMADFEGFCADLMSVCNVFFRKIIIISVILTTKCSCEVMAKLLTSCLVPSFLQHNLCLVVLGPCLLVVVKKFQDKFASLYIYIHTYIHTYIITLLLPPQKGFSGKMIILHYL